MSETELTSSLLCPGECVTLARDVACAPPDFLEKHGALLLTIMTAVGGGIGALLVYCLKSRCTQIDLCCIKLTREPVPVVELSSISQESVTGEAAVPGPSPPPSPSSEDRWNMDDAMLALNEIVSVGEVQYELAFKGHLPYYPEDEEDEHRYPPFHKTLISETWTHLGEEFWWRSDPRFDMDSSFRTSLVPPTNLKSLPTRRSIGTNTPGSPEPEQSRHVKGSGRVITLDLEEGEKTSRGMEAQSDPASNDFFPAINRDFE
uniref:Uncharacterized protein n=1 Tax=viral metagenome TaxID=1070528 RepID=A0A2V0RCH0_9ZZZZ